MAQALLFVMGLWWCVHAIRQFPSDVRDLESGELYSRLGIISAWLITLVVAAATILYAWGVVQRLLYYLQ